MDLLTGLMTGRLQASVPGPADDFWYGPAGAMTTSGLRIDEDGAKKISAWFRGRDILATSLAMLPLHVFTRLPGDQGAEVNPNHPAYDPLHRKPNGGQDSFQWRRESMYDLIDHGWAYSELVAGPRGFADQLLPIDAKNVTPERIKSGANRGRWLFHVRDETTNHTTVRTQDEIFYLRHGEGKGILDYARDSLGLGIVLERYASKLFSRGALHGGTITVPGPIATDAMTNMAKSYKTSMDDWHMPKILSHGATWKETTIEPEKAQFILSRKFSVNDIARWLGLPPHMLADLERSTNNNIEHQGQEFVTYSLGPWLSMWEFAINDQLILNPRRFYAEFVRDALVRGDIAARWDAYMKAVTTGTYTRNEVRRLENKKKLPGLDTPIEPANITGGRRATDPPPAKPANKAQAIVVESAARLLRKEAAQVKKFAVKHAADADAFATAVTDFYAAHVELVTQTLQMAEAEAASYCSQQAAQVLADWVGAVDRWHCASYAEGLAELALEQEAA